MSWLSKLFTSPPKPPQDPQWPAPVSEAHQQRWDEVRLRGISIGNSESAGKTVPGGWAPNIDQIDVWLTELSEWRDWRHLQLEGTAPADAPPPLPRSNTARYGAQDPEHSVAALQWMLLGPRHVNILSVTVAGDRTQAIGPHELMVELRELQAYRTRYAYEQEQALQASLSEAPSPAAVALAKRLEEGSPANQVSAEPVRPSLK